jgi:hypothetical protein
MRSQRLLKAGWREGLGERNPPPAHERLKMASAAPLLIQPVPAASGAPRFHTIEFHHMVLAMHQVEHRGSRQAAADS